MSNFGNIITIKLYINSQLYFSTFQHKKFTYFILKKLQIHALISSAFQEVRDATLDICHFDHVAYMETSHLFNIRNLFPLLASISSDYARIPLVAKKKYIIEHNIYLNKAYI